MTPPAPLPLGGAALPPVLLVGAGRMGTAMFAGWTKGELPPCVLVDPAAPRGVARPQDRLVGTLDAVPQGFRPGAVVLAIKPQMAASMLPALGAIIPDGAMLLSVLAGTSVARLAALLGTGNPVVRAMPNTPAAIGQGMTVAVAGTGVTDAQRALAETLLRVCGDLAWVEEERLVDAATAVSGCGPAYVFLLAELLEAEAVAQGLPKSLARRIARRTVSGAGALLEASAEDASELRRNVTSPNGVTQRALAVLMAPDAWPDSVARAVQAGVARARELNE